MRETPNAEQQDLKTPGAKENRWRSAALTAGGILLALGLLVIVASAIRSDGSDEFASLKPPQRIVDDCNQYASQTTRGTETARYTGAVSNERAIGAGAAGSATADGADRADEAAGIEAPTGAVAGTLYGVNGENRRTEVARLAYRECMTERGY